MELATNGVMNVLCGHRKNLYLFGIPGKIGGAATKISALIRLLRNDYKFTVVVPKLNYVRDKYIRNMSDEIGFDIITRSNLPSHADGIALGICEMDFFTSGIAEKAKQSGLKLFWSNEMMWQFKGEKVAARKGLIDKVLFVSEYQRNAFMDIYSGIPMAITGNYISPNEFKFIERRNHTFTIGRLSRPDPVKYPVDFPVFYEELNIGEVNFRVMAWDERIRKMYTWHRFDKRWDLIGTNKEPTEKFLHSLDLFIYPLGHRVKESWGRSTVEAMLTGAVPIVPNGHQFHNLIEHGESGYICQEFVDYNLCVSELYSDYQKRIHMARRCREHAVEELCNSNIHRNMWLDALNT